MAASTGDGPDEVRQARTLVRVGLGLLPVIALALHLRLGLRLMDAVAATFLVVTLPLFSVAQLPLVDPSQLPRDVIYRGSTISTGLLLGLALVAGASGVGLPAMGMGTVDAAILVGAALALCGAALVLTALSLFFERRLGIRDSPLLLHLIPRNSRERRRFVGVSLMAGFGEETVYRGYLLAVLAQPLGGVLPALAVSSLAFGMLHAYQGAAGMVRTAALGAMLGAGIVVTGSLWPAVLAHTLVDLVGGLIIGPRLVRRAETPT